MATLDVVVSAAPLTATWPPAVIVHLLPAASTIAAVEPARITVLSADGTGFGGTTTGTGLVAVPAAGPQASVGSVLLHHSLAPFSCQSRPFSKASAATPDVVVSATPLTATWPPAVIV